MNRVTLCLSYYENPGMLARQLADLFMLPADLRSSIDVIVVDDGSPTLPAFPIFKTFLPERGRLLRMGVDIPWNMDACRNLAVDQAETPWVLLTDIDHRIPEKTWRKILTAGIKPGVAYKFGRVSEPDLAPYKPHPNSWLMAKSLYDRAGGYDERFAGWYGTDGGFRDSIQAIAPVQSFKEHLIRVPREVTPDASTTTLVRKSAENLANLDRIKLEREKIKNWRPVRNRFPWERQL
jgi:hypothetical protein